MRNENHAALFKDARHKKRTTTPLVFAQNGDLVFGRIGRIMGHGVLTKETGRDQNINMPARCGRWHRAAVWVGKFIKRHKVGQFFDLAEFHMHHRSVFGVLVCINVFGRLPCGAAAFVFLCGDHVLIGLDRGFAVHWKGPRIGRREQVCGINCERLVFEL